MGGLGAVSFGPVVVDARSLPGADGRHRPSGARLPASQYAGWQIDREGYFAMASGPGRALIRAEELYDDLDVDERASTAVLASRRGDEPPAELAALRGRARRGGAGALTLLFAPTASLAGGVQIAARIVETALHKLHELEFDVAAGGERLRDLSLPPVARGRRKAIGRTNDAILYGGQVELTVDAPDDELEASSSSLPASASEDHGEPFGKVLEEADWDFYAIDPMLFSPAEVRLVSVESGRSFHAGGVRLDVLERSFRDDRRDGHDDDEPGRHRQLRRDGRGVGRRGDRHQAVSARRGRCATSRRAARRS